MGHPRTWITSRRRGLRKPKARKQPLALAHLTFESAVAEIWKATQPTQAIIACPECGESYTFDLADGHSAIVCSDCRDKILNAPPGERQTRHTSS